MARPPITLESLCDRAYQRGGFDGATGRFPRPMVRGLVNDSIADLWDQIVRARGYDTLAAASLITIEPGRSVYTMPASFLTLLSVSLDFGEGPVRLERFAQAERARLHYPSAPPFGASYYQLVGDNIEILPVPAKVGTLEVRFVPAAPLLEDDPQLFDGVNGWEEWVTVDVARKMATRERDWEQVSVLERDLGRLAARVLHAAGARDRASVRRVVDVRGGRRSLWRRRA